MINISDNGISNEGLKVIAKQGFTLESSLVSINLANNDLKGEVAIQCFTEILTNSKCLYELNLNDNSIGDSGIVELSKLLN